MTLIRPHHGDFLTPSELDAYLARIGVDQPVSLDFKGLSRLHRAHLLNVTWEGLDAFMGWPGEIGLESAFAKIVEARRGGWCFEMNGLFGAALKALGFPVTRLCGCVDRGTLGNQAIGNHLSLLVDLDQPYLCEVGVGDAIVDPIPLVPGTYTQRGFQFVLSETGDEWLRLANHSRGVARTVDFRPGYQDEPAMEAMHKWLMTDARSPFTGALAMIRHHEHGYSGLQNCWLRHVTASEVSAVRISSADHFADVLATVFQLDVPRPDRVWDKIQDKTCELAA